MTKPSPKTSSNSATKNSRNTREQEKKATSPPPKKLKPGQTIPKTEMFLRLEVVEDAIESGIYTRKDLINHLVDKGFPRVSRSTMDGYIKRVRTRWEQERVKDREILRDEAIRRLRKYLARMVKRLIKKEPNYSDLVALLKELHKVEGVYAPEQHEVSVKHEYDGWSDDELDHYVKTGEEPPRLKEPKHENHANGRVLH